MPNKSSAQSSTNVDVLALLAHQVNMLKSPEVFGIASVTKSAINTMDLRRVLIPGMKLDLSTAGAQAGVNYHVAHLTANGLIAHVQRYQDMALNDWLEIFWDDDARYDDPTLRPVASRAVTQEDIDGAGGLSLYVPSEKVPGRGVEAGVIKSLWVQVTRQGGLNQEKSPTLSVLSRLVFPGGSDPEPDRAGHYGLKAPVVTVPANGRITEADAIAGVKVQIPAYRNMREYDRIRLSWGGEFIDYEVKMGEAGGPVVLDIPEQTIRAAGDSESLVLTYRVVDEVDNQSSDWSLRGMVRVALENGLIDAPEIMDIDGMDPTDTIDLAVLGDSDQLVYVRPNRGLIAGDMITLHWLGTDAAGEQFPVNLPAQRYNARTLRFSVSNEALLMLSEGSGSAYYSYKRGGEPAYQLQTRVRQHHRRSATQSSACST